MRDLFTLQAKFDFYGKSVYILQLLYDWIKCKLKLRDERGHSLRAVAMKRLIYLFLSDSFSINYLLYTKHSFLTPIWKIIISRTHVIETSLVLELKNHALKGCWGIVEKRIHLWRFFLHRLGAAPAGFFKAAVISCSCQADCYVFWFRVPEVQAWPHSCGILEQFAHFPWEGVVIYWINSFHHVISIRTTSPLPSISCLAITSGTVVVMRVGTGPLNVE